jgi:predicted nucleic acid-binding protein
MVRFLLDTNVISETRRKAPNPELLAWLAGVDPAALYVSVLSFGEIAKGIALISRKNLEAGLALREWFGEARRLYAERLVPIDADIAEEWGRLSSIRSLPVVDGLLAATASIHKMTLVTRNLRDMEGTGVLLFNPWEKSQ